MRLPSDQLRAIPQAQLMDYLRIFKKKRDSEIEELLRNSTLTKDYNVTAAELREFAEQLYQGKLQEMKSYVQSLKDMLETVTNGT